MNWIHTTSLTLGRRYELDPHLTLGRRYELYPHLTLGRRYELYPHLTLGRRYELYPHLQFNLQSCVLHCLRSSMEPPKLCAALFTFPHGTSKAVSCIVYVPPWNLQRCVLHCLRSPMKPSKLCTAFTPPPPLKM